MQVPSKCHFLQGVSKFGSRSHDRLPCLIQSSTKQVSLRNKPGQLLAILIQKQPATDMVAVHNRHDELIRKGIPLSRHSCRNVADVKRRVSGKHGHAIPEIRWSSSRAPKTNSTLRISAFNLICRVDRPKQAQTSWPSKLL